HRPVSLNQDRKGELRDLVAARHEPFQELTVGEAAEGPGVEQRVDLPQDRTRVAPDHSDPPPRPMPLLFFYAVKGAIRSHDPGRIEGSRRSARLKPPGEASTAFGEPLVPERRPSQLDRDGREPGFRNSPRVSPRARPARGEGRARG